jgi:hypothetical protein
MSNWLAVLIFLLAVAPLVYATLLDHLDGEEL